MISFLIAETFTTSLGRLTNDEQKAAKTSAFDLQMEGLKTRAGIYNGLAGHFRAAGHRPFDHVVVDEAQDVSVPQLRFRAALAADGPDGPPPRT